LIHLLCRPKGHHYNAAIRFSFLVRSAQHAAHGAIRDSMMASPNSKSYRRMTGRLRLNGRGAMLETADDSLIFLASSDDLTAFDGHRVVVEGQLSGLDRLTITWIGPAAE
jgi:Protein of unknown function (DUF5818)